MVSKILIDVDENNEPVIKVEYFRDSTQPNDDVRDKLVKRFVEGFGHNSNLASVIFEDNMINFSNGFQKRSTLIIRPLSNTIMNEE